MNDKDLGLGPFRKDGRFGKGSFFGVTILYQLGLCHLSQK